MKRFFAIPIGVAVLSLAAQAQTGPTTATAPQPAPPEMEVHVVHFDGGAGAFQQSLKPVLNSPYQADTSTESTQHLADGNVIQNTHTSKVARDSQGRTWTEETIEKMGPWSSESGPHTVVFISDPVAQTSYVLHPDTKTAEKMPFVKALANLAKAKTVGPGQTMDVVSAGGAPPGDVGFATTISAKAVDLDAHDRQVQDLGTQQINGVSAQGKRTTVTIPANTFGNQLPIVTVTETWYSPDLQMVIQSKRDDPRFGESTFSVQNIQKGEPPADLFQVPSDYTVSSGPSKPLHLQVGPQ